MASTIAPTRALAESAQCTGRNAFAPFITLITARSSGVNTPTSLAFMGVLTVEILTSNFLTVPITCAFVTMSPCRSKTTPEPVARPALISTTDGNDLAIVDS